MHETQPEMAEVVDVGVQQESDIHDGQLSILDGTVQLTLVDEFPELSLAA